MVVYIDYPRENSLLQIYGTYVNAILRISPGLSTYSELLVSALVDFYLASKTRFTADQFAHYVYSPRELTRWIRGLAEQRTELTNLESLLQISIYEGLRLFSDRLVTSEEHDWTRTTMKSIFEKHLPAVAVSECFTNDLLFTHWISKGYVKCSFEEIKECAREKLRLFCEEETEVKLVMSDEIVEHALKIDRVLRLNSLFGF
jgi:dynein heavy chain 1